MKSVTPSPLKTQAAKTAVICARVSTDQQAEQGRSIPTQLAAMRKYAEQHSLAVIAETTDEISGTIPIRERKGGAQLYEYIDGRNADAVIFYTVDRVTRDEDLIEINVIRRDVRNAGMELHYANDGGKTDLTTMGGMIDTLKAAVAAEERKKIRERSMRGRWAKAASGQYVKAHKTPYGYRDCEGGLAVGEPEAETVRTIYRWYVYGDDGQPMTLRGIARRLTENGVPTPADSSGAKYQRKSKGWQMFIVRHILTIETYAGRYRYGVTQWRDGQRIEREREPVTVAVPAIVSDELWQAAQKRLAFNAQAYKAHPTREYLLRGLVTCETCKGAMAGKARRDPRNRDLWRTFYRCSSASRKQRTVDHVCGGANRYVPSAWIERETWQFAQDVLCGDGFEQRLRDAQTAEADSVQPIRDEIAQIDRLMSDCKAEANRIAAEIGRIDRTTSPLMTSALDERGRATEARYASLSKRKADLEARLSSQITEADIQAALEFRDDVMAGMTDPTYEDKRRVFDLLRAEVIITPNRAEDKAKINFHLAGSKDAEPLMKDTSRSFWQAKSKPSQRQ